MRPPAHFGSPLTFHGTTRYSTAGSFGSARMRPPAHFGALPHTCRGRTGSLWQRSHAPPGTFRHNPRTICGPTGSSAEGFCDSARMRPTAHA
eukprot:446302-Pyramimonas_sp.AAC.1